MALTGRGSEKEQDTPIERIKRLEEMINKLYIKCPICQGYYIKECDENFATQCAICDKGFIKVQIKE